MCSTTSNAANTCGSTPTIGEFVLARGSGAAVEVDIVVGELNEGCPVPGEVKTGPISPPNRALVSQQAASYLDGAA